MIGADVFARGDRIGDYEILQRLRSGGMATLFLGRRHGVQGVSRLVVIKVIHPHLAEDDLIVRMFIDEARISSHISHGNVVYVETFGEHRGTYYLVMEYVDGCSAEQLLRTLSRRREQLTPEVAVHIAIEAAAGLHAAHETVGDDGAPLGIVHRDVSPSNILLTRDGGIKVIDFGIAKARGRLGVTEGGGGLKGKIRYMSPEQAWGRELDRRSDVYALGIVLWELLACRQLYRGDDDLAVLERVRRPDIPPPSTMNPKVPPALDGVLLRATAPDPEQRLATALEFRRQLMHAVPTAVSIPEESLPHLVGQVRETLGELVLGDPEEEKATTPATPSSQGVRPLTESTVIEIVPSTGSSVRAAVGELQASRRRVGAAWMIAGGVVIAGAVAIGLVVRGGSDRAGAASDSPSHPPAATMPAPTARTPVVAPPTAPPPPASAPADAPAADPVVIARPATRPDRTPRTGHATKATKRTPPDRDPTSSGAREVNVDGTVLADDSETPRPPARPRDSVRADGKVLAE